MIVSNSTPLIYLAKIGKLSLLQKFFHEVIIPNEVKLEVIDAGIKLNSPDALIVQRSLEDGWIKVKETKTLKHLEEFGIDKGEAEAISLAINIKSSEILIDQTHARLAAKTLGLKPRGTLYVLLRALKEKTITYDEYLEFLEELVRHGFRLREEVYLEAIRMGKNLK